MLKALLKPHHRRDTLKSTPGRGKSKDVRWVLVQKIREAHPSRQNETGEALLSIRRSHKFNGADCHHRPSIELTAFRRIRALLLVVFLDLFNVDVADSDSRDTDAHGWRR
ncbi:MAG: hypothetical protein M3R15_09430, partial [Acidobacteriota bacterium]|nr:hypothetical protein [Acidobacteriota bacterium]